MLMYRSTDQNIKARLSPYKKGVFIFFNESPLKMTKKTFCFVLRAFFVCEIFTSLCSFFGYIGKRLDKKGGSAYFKLRRAIHMTSQHFVALSK